MKAFFTSGHNLLIAAVCLALSTSCNKSATVAPPAPGAVSQEKLFNSIVSTTDANATDDDVFTAMLDDGTEDVSSLLPACAIRTYSPSKSVYPQTVTTDYGGGCVDQYGRVKKGKIIVTYSGKKKDPGTIIAGKFENFYSNTTHIEGKYVIQNISTAGGPLTFSYLTESTSSFANGTTITILTTKTSVQTDGLSTPKDGTDDGYTTTGTILGMTASSTGQVYYASQIDKNHPLHRMNACHFPDSGIINAGVAGSGGIFVLESIDYGNGTCDDQAMFTYAGKTSPVTLPFRLWPVQ